MSKNDLFVIGLFDKLQMKKAIARVKILKIIAELSLELSSHQREKLQHLNKHDSAVLVQELSHKILSK